jgi:hypothetical protein
MFDCCIDINHDLKGNFMPLQKALWCGETHMQLINMDMYQVLHVSIVNISHWWFFFTMTCMSQQSLSTCTPFPFLTTYSFFREWVCVHFFRSQLFLVLMNILHKNINIWDILYYGITCHDETSDITLVS